MKLSILLLVFLFIIASVTAQSDSTKAKPATHACSHVDSVHLARLNTSGTLMIGGGVALCAAGGYFIYEGTQVYNAMPDPASTNPTADISRNHQQGTAYLIAGGISIVGGFILGGFGIKNKVHFKKRLKYMSLQTGLLPDGSLGASLTF